MQEIRVQSLGWEDLLDKEMATHYNILAMDREAWETTVYGVTKELEMTYRLNNKSKTSSTILYCSLYQIEGRQMNYHC